MRPKSRSTVLLVNFRGILCNVIDSKDIPTLWCCSLSCFNSAYSCSCCLGSFWFFVFNTSLFIVILFSSIYCQKNGFSETVSLFLFLFGNGFDASFGVFVQVCECECAIQNRILNFFSPIFKSLFYGIYRFYINHE